MRGLLLRKLNQNLILSMNMSWEKRKLERLLLLQLLILRKGFVSLLKILMLRMQRTMLQLAVNYYWKTLKEEIL